MNPAWRGTFQRLGLGFAVCSALLFAPSLEDAYVLPQRLALSLAAMLLALGAPARVQVGRLGWLLLVFFGWRVLGFALAQPPVPGWPWLGEQLLLAVLLVYGGAALREESGRRYLATVALAVGALGAGLGLLAPLGWDPWMDGAVDLGFGRRAYGTLGNPDFLGGWLALLLPLSIVSSLQAQNWARRGAMVSGALMVAALFATQARASWLAAAVGCGVALALARPAWFTLRRLMACGLGLLLLLGLGVSQRQRLPPRWAEALDFRSDAWQSRVFMGSVALDLARQHPVIGVGGGGFGDAYLGRQGERLSAGEAQPYRYTHDAHNDWLQIAAESGWLALALWLAALAWAWRWAWARKAGALAGGLAAFAVQACFHFPWAIWPSAALLVLGLGLIAAQAEDAPPLALGPVWGWACVALLLLNFADGLRAWASSALLNRGTAVQINHATRPLAPALLAKAAALRPSDERAWQRLGAQQLRLGQLDQAIGSYQAALRAAPQHPDAWINLGLALGTQGRLDAAEQACAQGVALNPRNREAWANWSKVAWLRGDSRNAEARLRLGMERAGPSVQAAFNLGAILYNQQRFKEAAAAFQQVLDLDPSHNEAARLLRESAHAR